MDSLPSMEHTFELNKKGNSTGRIYQGQFTYKRLDIGDQGRAGILKTRLNGDLENVDIDIDKMHDMMSWLRFGLVDYPSWWRESEYGSKLYDFNILEEIWRNCNDFEKRWLEKVNKVTNESISSDSNK